MRIAYVLPQYLPSTSGDVKETHKIAKRLVHKGHDVAVYTTDAASEDALSTSRGKILKNGQDVVDSVQVLRFPVQSRLPINIPKVKVLVEGHRFLVNSEKIGKYVDNIKAAKGIKYTASNVFKSFTRLPISRRLYEGLLTDKGYDIYHAVGISVRTALYAYQASLKNRIPLVIKPAFHSADKIYYNPTNLAILNHARAIITNTDAEVDIFGRLGIDTRKMRVVGCGVNLEEYLRVDQIAIEQSKSDWNIRNYEMNVLFLSRLQKEKGVFDIIDSIIKLNDSGRRIQLVIAGADYAENSRIIQRLAQRHPFIKYFGQVSEEKKINLLHSCDVLAVPSIMDSFGIVYIEAWACSKPVIGADIPSTRSLISAGNDGYYIEYGDRSTLAEKLSYLADNPTVRVEMGKIGHMKVRESYTDDKVFEATCQVYEDLLSGKL
jgi:glycosyltransferase involved in cell wall biosynthesis